MRPRISFALTTLLFLLIIVIPTMAAPNNEITVCSVGCDYAAIQPAIDAATSGDQIIVASGVYTEQLTLRSGITLTAQNGPLTTFITALASPIISGSDIYSVTVQGFRIQGSPTVSIPNGIVLTNSSMIISNVIIGNLYGANGTISNPNGLTAIGLQLSGAISVTLTNSIIENIEGGTAEVNSSGRGGDGFGINAAGEGQLQVIASTVRNIIGGTPGMAGYAVGCDGIGGRSFGISKSGSSILIIEQSTVSDLAGGPPCHNDASPYPCPNNAGDAISIQTISGTLDIHYSRLINNGVWRSNQNAKSIGIVASNNARINVENTEISALAIIGANTVHATTVSATESPFCTSGNSSAIGLWLDSDTNATIEHNVVQNLHGAGMNGQASGLYAQHTQYITVTSNQVSNLTGGSAWYPQASIHLATYGILIDDGVQATIDADRVSHLYGGQGEVFGYGMKSRGGEIVGLQVISTTGSDITNNVLDSLVGGNGANFPSTWTGEIHNGGNATGLRIDGGTCTVQNNSLYFMQGGDRGYPSDIDGQGISFRLNGILNAFVTNNAFISSTIGVSSTTSNYLWDYNDLWHNTLDYTGIITGPHDLHLDPVFADSFNNDFHLKFGSPLIDTGFNIGAPNHDIDGNLRPLDGNYDKQAQADIGAFEYQPVKLFIVYLPLIMKVSN